VGGDLVALMRAGLSVLLSVTAYCAGMLVVMSCEGETEGESGAAIDAAPDRVTDAAVEPRACGDYADPGAACSENPSCAELLGTPATSASECTIRSRWACGPFLDSRSTEAGPTSNDGCWPGQRCVPFEANSCWLDASNPPLCLQLINRKMYLCWPPEGEP
jgi:hypothetical protein